MDNSLEWEIGEPGSLLKEGMMHSLLPPPVGWLAGQTKSYRLG